ncbi:MAG: hypothetical protein R8G33_03705 [Gammaproteobacteria bacterium]|nr:hypothetical protein [Gammaproteobacteria bacterium]
MQKTKPRRPERRAGNLKKNTKEAYSRERRKKSSERRHSETVAQFPIITTQGICVRKERRKLPERRISNIVVRETVMNEEVFETLFSNYLKYKERMRLAANKLNS